jgi:regulatory protein
MPKASRSSSPAEPDVSRPDESFARQILLRRLEDQPRSRAELAESLAKKNVPVEIATELLDRFEEVGLINDADLARQWVQSRQRTRGLAPRVLAMELRRKGIDDEIISEVLGELDPADARAAAHRLVQKKLRSMASLDDTTRIRRLTSMLARKGYAPQLAFDVVREELEAATV